jgi:hypothetical protein
MGLRILVFGHFQDAFSDEDFKVASVVCGGSNEPSVQRAW